MWAFPAAGIMGVMTQRRQVIVTPAQYHQGWLERRGDTVVAHPFTVVMRLEDGNYVVLDPETERPSA